MVCSTVTLSTVACLTGLDRVVVLLNAGRADGDTGVLQEELRVHVAQNFAVALGLHDLEQEKYPGVAQRR